MKTVTAKQLKNQTGEILREVRRGTKVLVTRRGKPVAVVSPADAIEVETADLRPFEEAWAGIEKALAKSAPRFSTWQEAMRWSRRRG